MSEKLKNVKPHRFEDEMFDLRDPGFQQKLNSMTKYPPIPTFHEMDPKTGMLDGSKRVDFGGQPAQVTEKIDGTNARIIVLPRRFSEDGAVHWIIGSRENLLSSNRDWIRNPELGIVDGLTGTATELLVRQSRIDDDSSPVRVYFFEVYGGRIGQSWKNYSKHPDAVGHRLFDVIEFSDELFLETLSHSREEISSWRQHGGQPFVDWDRLLEIAQDQDLQRVPPIDYGVDVGNGDFDTLQGTLEALEGWFPNGSRAWLEPTALKGTEGVVFRSRDSQTVAKLRFQDYRGTLNRLEKAAHRKFIQGLREVE